MPCERIAVWCAHVVELLALQTPERGAMMEFQNFSSEIGHIQAVANHNYISVFVKPNGPIRNI